MYTTQTTALKNGVNEGEGKGAFKKPILHPFKNLSFQQIAA